MHIKLILSNEPLLGCPNILLPDWLKNSNSIFSFDSFDDNLCVFRCIVAHKRITKRLKRTQERTTNNALKLAREFYQKSKMKRKDVPKMSFFDFEQFEKQFDVNIKLYEPTEEKKWFLVYSNGKKEEKNKTCNIGIIEGHCFLIKDFETLIKIF